MYVCVEMEKRKLFSLAKVANMTKTNCLSHRFIHSFIIIYYVYTYMKMMVNLLLLLLLF